MQASDHIHKLLVCVLVFEREHPIALTSSSDSPSACVKLKGLAEPGIIALSSSSPCTMILAKKSV